MNPYPVWTPEMRREADRLYWDEGESTLVIAKRFGLSVNSVNHAFRYYGIPVRTRQQAAVLREKMGRGVGNRRKAA